MDFVVSNVVRICAFKKALNSIESVSFKLGRVVAGETAYSQHFPFHFILSLDILD